MNAREKKLAIAVGIIVLLIVNFLLLEFFFKQQGRLRADLGRKQKTLASARTFFEEKELWEKRQAWILAHQPKLTSPDRDGAALRDAVQEIAKKHNFVMQAEAFEKPELGPFATSISIKFETKSSWEALCAFLREVQGPQQFMLFERAHIQVDSADKTQMHGKFRVAKWFAPNAAK